MTGDELCAKISPLKKVSNAAKKLKVIIVEKIVRFMFASRK
jgi:hypothetical protein